jgi:glutamine synthetase type III
MLYINKIIKISAEIKKISTNTNLVIVTKNQDQNVITHLVDAGYVHFGENRIQDADKKWKNVIAANKNINLHLIGPVQSNKAKDAYRIFNYIHSLESEKVAKIFSNLDSKQPKKIKYFIQVNIGDEQQKNGVKFSDASNFINFCIKELKLNVVGKIPEILLDNTDRNRTSPFAFTGNKFELRAVGSLANCAEPMTVLNAMVAKQLITFKGEVDALIDNKGLKKDEAIFNVLREYIKVSKNILFEGDGYSEEWAKEAKKRGLSNLKTTPEALKRELDQKFVSLYEELGIYSHREFEARNEIKLEKYSTNIDIEARVIADIARNHIVPAALKYQNRLIENVKGLKEIFSEKEFKVLAKEQLDLIALISGHVSTIKLGVDELLISKEKAKNTAGSQKQAEIYCNNVKPLFDNIREASDALEMLVDDELWPLTKYREMLFTR